jgi:hypothetical protein
MRGKINSLYAILKARILPETQVINQKKRNRIIIAAVMFLFLVLAFVRYQNELSIELYKLKLVPQGETFTELYFEDYAGISREAPQSGKAVPFSFVINNLEGVDKSYNYIVYFQNDEKKFLMDKGTVDLDDGQGFSVKENYVFQGNYPEGRVVVKIINSGQEIHFSLG